MSKTRKVRAKNIDQMEQLKAKYRAELLRYFQNVEYRIPISEEESAVLDKSSVSLQFEITFETFLTYADDGLFLTTVLL